MITKPYCIKLAKWHLDRLGLALEEPYSQIGTLFLSTELCSIKDGLILESFSLQLKYHNMGVNHDPEHVLYRWIVVRVAIWHPFLEILAKVKKYLRLSRTVI